MSFLFFELHLFFFDPHEVHIWILYADGLELHSWLLLLSIYLSGRLSLLIVSLDLHCVSYLRRLLAQVGAAIVAPGDVYEFFHHALVDYVNAFYQCAHDFSGVVHF